MVATVRRGRGKARPKVQIAVPAGVDDFAAFEYVEQHGGVATVQVNLEKAQSVMEKAQLAFEAAQAEVNDLARVLEGHARLGQRYEGTKKSAKGKVAVA